MDKATGSPVQMDGETVRAAAEFIPEGSGGTVELSFKSSGSALAGRTMVAFEVLYDGGKEVAVHEYHLKIHRSHAVCLEDSTQAVFYYGSVTPAARRADCKSVT